MNTLKIQNNPYMGVVTRRSELAVGRLKPPLRVRTPNSYTAGRLVGSEQVNHTPQRTVFMIVDGGIRMEFLLQRFWHISVVREAEECIKSTAVYSDSGGELAVVFKVDVHDFVIREAYLRRLGGPGNMTERRIPLSGLVGVSAYLGSGSELRQGLKDIPGEGVRSLVRSLVNETVTSLVQAETFLY